VARADHLAGLANALVQKISSALVPGSGADRGAAFFFSPVATSSRDRVSLYSRWAADILRVSDSANLQRNFDDQGIFGTVDIN